MDLKEYFDVMLQSVDSIIVNKAKKSLKLLCLIDFVNSRRTKLLWLINMLKAVYPRDHYIIIIKLLHLILIYESLEIFYTRIIISCLKKQVHFIVYVSYQHNHSIKFKDRSVIQKEHLSLTLITLSTKLGHSFPVFVSCHVAQRSSTVKKYSGISDDLVQQK